MNTLETLQVKEPELYKLFCNLIESFLKSLEKTNMEEILLSSSKSRYWNSWSLLLRNYDFLHSLKEYQELDKWIKNHPEIEKQFSKYVGYGHIFSSYPLWNVVLRQANEFYMDNSYINVHLLF